MYHPRADIERLYVKRKNGGRLFQLELTYKITTAGLKKYLDTLTKWMPEFVNRREAKVKNIQLVKKVINLLINSTLHRKK